MQVCGEILTDGKTKTRRLTGSVTGVGTIKPLFGLVDLTERGSSTTPAVGDLT